MRVIFVSESKVAHSVTGPVCSDPGRPADGKQIATSYEVGKTVTFDCDRPGFVAEPSSIECVSNNGTAQWSDVLVYATTQPNDISTGTANQIHITSTSAPTQSDITSTAEPTQSDITSTDEPTQSDITSTDEPTQSDITTTDVPTQSDITTTDVPTQSDITTTDVPTQSDITTEIPRKRCVGKYFLKVVTFKTSHVR